MTGSDAEARPLDLMAEHDADLIVRVRILVLVLQLVAVEAQEVPVCHPPIRPQAGPLGPFLPQTSGDRPSMSIILYGAPLSPFVRKADAFLREKGADFELESVNIMPMPDWFKEISPARRIPVLRDTTIGKEGPLGTIPDSSAICAYIERKFPEPALYPSDPYEHGRAVWLEEYCDSELAAPIGMGIFRPIQFARFQGKEPDVEAAKKTYAKSLPRPLDYLENEIGDSGFLVGETLSIADVSLACQLVQLELVAGPLDAARWPRAAGLVERLSKRDSFVPCIAICRKIVKQDPIDLRA